MQQNGPRPFSIDEGCVFFKVKSSETLLIFFVPEDIFEMLQVTNRQTSFSCGSWTISIL
jgi:hypothetical protein